MWAARVVFWWPVRWPRGMNHGALEHRCFFIARVPLGGCLVMPDNYSVGAR